MKKYWFTAAVAVLAAGSAMAQANDTLAKIKNAGAITLGVRESSGLSYTLGNGKYVGFHTEMAEHIIGTCKSSWACPSSTSSTSPSPRKTACRW